MEYFRLFIHSGKHRSTKFWNIAPGLTLDVVTCLHPEYFAGKMFHCNFKSCQIILKP